MAAGAILINWHVKGHVDTCKIVETIALKWNSQRERREGIIGSVDRSLTSFVD